MLTAILVMVPLLTAPMDLPAGQASPPTVQQKVGPKPCTLEVQKLIDTALVEKDGKKKLAKLQAALRLATYRGDRQGQGLCLLAIGNAKWDGYDKSCPDDYESARKWFRETQDSYGEATTLDSSGVVLYSLGDMNGAMAKFEEALPLRRKCGDFRGEAETLTNIGAVLSSLGDKKGAKAKLEEALPLTRKCGDVLGEATALNNIGAMLADVGDMKGALAKYEEVLPLLRKCGDVLGEAQTLNNIGGVLYSLGDKKGAAAKMEEALPLLRKCEDVRGEAVTLNNIGAIMNSLGDMKGAMAKYEEALSLRRKCGDVLGEAGTLNNIGALLDSLGDKKGAMAKYEETLPLLRKAGDIRDEANTLNSIGVVLSSLGDEKGAIAKYEAALTLRRKCGDIQGEAVTLINMGSVRAVLGDLNGAMAKYEEALPLMRTCEDVRGEANTLYKMGFGLAGSGMDAGSSVAFKQSVLGFHKLRRKAVGLTDALQRSFASSMVAAYSGLYDALVMQGRFPEAERSQAMIVSARLNLGLSRGSPAKGELELDLAYTMAEQAYVDRFEANIAALVKKLDAIAAMRNKPQPLPGHGESVKSMEADYDDAVKKFGAQTEAASKALVKAKPTEEDLKRMETAGDLPKIVANLSQQTGSLTAALSTVVTDKVLVSVLTLPDGTRKSHRLDVKPAEFNKRVLRCLGLLKSRGSDPRAETGALLMEIFGPLLDEIKARSVTTLALSLDGALKALPWEALWDVKAGKWLGEELMLPRFNPAWTERLVEASSPAWKVAVFGNGKNDDGVLDIPGAPLEADAIAKATGAASWVGDAKFTSDSFLAALMKPQFSVAHVASHFYIEPGSDAKSVLLCGGGRQTVSLTQMRNPNLKGFEALELLVLSACSTGVDNGDGAGIEGLTGTKQVPGPKAVLASLWSVDDAATRKLMTRFYSLRESYKDWTKLQCLATAQKELRSGALGKPGDASWRSGTTSPPPALGERWNGPGLHPYYWAPFVLFGNWR